MSRVISRRTFLKGLTAGTVIVGLTRASFTPSLSLGADLTFAELCASLAPGHWLKANLDKFSDHWPPQNFAVPYPHYRNGPKSVLRAWAASAFDHVHGDWYFWGGGHANYLGNEVYRWRTSTRLWERCCLPSHMTNRGDNRWEATVGGIFDAPVASHAYDTTVYLPQLNKIFVGGGAMYGASGIWKRTYPSTEKTGPYLWDVTKTDPNKVGGSDFSNWENGDLINPGTALGLQAWENRDRFQYNVNVKGYGAPLGYCDVAVEDGKDVVYIGWGGSTGTAGVVVRYELGATPAEDVLIKMGTVGEASAPNQGAAAWDPTRRHFVVARGNSTGSSSSLLLYDLSQFVPGRPVPNVTIQFVDLDGYFTTRNKREFGIVYDIGRDLYWLWEGEKEVYSLTPGAGDGKVGWAITKHYDPTVLLYPQAQAELGLGWKGTLGKWVYDPNNDMLLGIYNPGTERNTTNSGDIWVYKPPVPL